MDFSALQGLFHPASASLRIKAPGEVEANVEGLVLFSNLLGTKNFPKHTAVFLQGVKNASFYCLKGSTSPCPSLVAFRKGSIPARA